MHWGDDLLPTENIPPPVLKFLTPPPLPPFPSPQTLYSPPLTGNKQDVKLMHKTFIQRNCQQTKKMKSK